MKKACSEIAREAKIDGWDHPTTDQFDIVMRWLRDVDSGDWLLVLDNADDINLFYGSSGLAALLPRSDNGVILMTTRNAQVRKKFAARNSITVKALSKLAASDLLEARLPTDFSTSITEIRTPRTLLLLLGISHLNISDRLQQWRQKYFQ